MSFPKDLIREHPSLGDWNILHAYRGSIAHGMYIPKNDPISIDDKDTMGICVPPKEYFIGTKKFAKRGTKEIKRDEWDIVIYEIRKAISLLTKGNPNMLSLLWVTPQYYINITWAGQLLIDNRDLFSGRHVYKSFAGYASGQLKRMTKGNRQGHMGEKRKELIEQFGYDTKNAAHLMRLLRMGIEFLSTGELNIERHDAKELLEIKRGEWSLVKVKREAELLFSDHRQALINSPLPLAPDKEAINALCMAVVELAHKGHDEY